MSRTFRRKNVIAEKWYTHDWVTAFESDWKREAYVHVPKSKAVLKKGLARWHSDAGTYACKEPGPAWFRNLTRQRPLRRKGKEELRKFMLNEEHEVMITENPPLAYWT